MVDHRALWALCTPMDSVEAFIAARLELVPAPAVPEIRLYRATPSSGVGRFSGDDGAPPYWAYGWAGGTVLARYLLDYPHVIAGKRVLDLGCGSGIVAIAAAKAGAAAVLAVDIDANAVIATRMNASANGVAVETMAGDILGEEPDAVDLILVGDLFYDGNTAHRVADFLARNDIESLIGDPHRAHLPYGRLEKLAEYTVPDFGIGQTARPSAVFRFLSDSH